jgi:protein-S-isoprenylcysteine O-methyltransferase Ste14
MIIVRKVYTSEFRTQDTVIEKKTTIDLILLALNGVAMLIPLVYVFSSSLDFADYDLPSWLGWIGSGFFLAAILLLWRSHADLGRNWTVTLGLRYKHGLVTNGIYKYIRHPMYAAHLLWAIAQIMILHNWLVAYLFLITFTMLYLLRVHKEEQMMLDQFGHDYEMYIERTGRLIPKLTRVETR